jgi:tRNA nucleotidyltransferase (CCA-adding enzyme)
MHRIVLSALETELCNDLLRITKEKNLNTVLRIAGGWVRDKLLNLESYDIDIALDNMMGEDFAKIFAQEVGASSVGKIRANPEASKHLETACVRYKGIDLDFVNLRSENYSDDSRIPSIVIYN